MEQTHKLNTGNPEAISYTTGELSITILGGIRLEGLDRMRVTLKIEVSDRKFKHYLNNPDIADLAIRHSLDLYNDIQVEKLIRKTAERLEIGSSQITKAIADITNQLEEYRLQRIEEQRSNQKPKPKQLTETETIEAKLFLQASGLLQRTSEAIANTGLTGEEINSLLMYIIFTSRKRETPLHIISLGSSGTGKTYLQERVSELIPVEDKLEITILSENAFYYFGQHELKNKLILIEDLDGAENVLYPLRELKSKSRITKTVTIKDTKGQTKTIHLTVEGPVCIAGCTTHESLYEDNANRSFLIYLDESKEQDERIMQRQRLISAGKINTEEEQKIKKLLQNCQRLLQPITVKNPFAEYLKIPEEVFKPRRTNNHYLQFVEAITFYHQYQREQKADETSGEIYIETTLQDIESANSLMKPILLRKSDELTGACRSYLEKVKAYLEYENKKTFKNSDIRKALKINVSNQKRYTLILTDGFYIKKVKDNKAKGHEYEITSYEEFKQLQTRISGALDESLASLKKIFTDKERFTGSEVVQTKNEPLKKKRAKKLQEQSTVI